jgi:uncharacterized lipoprotein YmbA
MIRRRVLLMLAAVPAACASPEPVLYTLVAVPGTPRADTPRVIELRKIALADYLTRSQIVRSAQDVRLDVLDGASWGERFDPMLTRILVQDLTERLPGTLVLARNGAIADSPTSHIDINIQRLDADRSGTVVLVAQIAITGRDAGMRSVQLVAPSQSPDTSDLVSAMSTVTAQLADSIAEMFDVAPVPVATPKPKPKHDGSEVRRLKKRLGHMQEQRDTLKKAVDSLSGVPKQ